MIMNLDNLFVVKGNISKITPAQRGDKNFCYLTVAVNKGKDKEGNPRPATFIDCDAWNKNAEFIEKYCQVGDLVQAVGFIEKNTYEKDGQKTSRQYLLVDHIQKLASKGAGKNAGGDEPVPVEADNSADNIDISQDDLPF